MVTITNLEKAYLKFLKLNPQDIPDPRIEDSGATTALARQAIPKSIPELMSPGAEMQYSMYVEKPLPDLAANQKETRDFIKKIFKYVEWRRACDVEQQACKYPELTADIAREINEVILDIFSMKRSDREFSYILAKLLSCTPTYNPQYTLCVAKPKTSLMARPVMFYNPEFVMKFALQTLRYMRNSAIKYGSSLGVGRGDDAILWDAIYHLVIHELNHIRLGHMSRSINRFITDNTFGENPTSVEESQANCTKVRLMLPMGLYFHGFVKKGPQNTDSYVGGIAATTSLEEAAKYVHKGNIFKYLSFEYFLAAKTEQEIWDHYYGAMMGGKPNLTQQQVDDITLVLMDNIIGETTPNVNNQKPEVNGQMPKTVIAQSGQKQEGAPSPGGGIKPKRIIDLRKDKKEPPKPEQGAQAGQGGGEGEGTSTEPKKGPESGQAAGKAGGEQGQGEPKPGQGAGGGKGKPSGEKPGQGKADAGAGDGEKDSGEGEGEGQAASGAGASKGASKQPGAKGEPAKAASGEKSKGEVGQTSKGEPGGAGGSGGGHDDAWTPDMGGTSDGLADPSNSTPDDMIFDGEVAKLVGDATEGANGGLANLEVVEKKKICSRSAIKIFTQYVKSSIMKEEYASDLESRRIEGVFGRDVDAPSFGDILAIIDVSGSMDKGELGKMAYNTYLEISKAIKQRKIRMTIIVFASHFTVERNVTVRSANMMVAVIKKLAAKAGGGTTWNNVLTYGKAHIKAAKGVIIMTDFEFNENVTTALKYKSLLRSKSVPHLIVVPNSYDRTKYMALRKGLMRAVVCVNPKIA